MTCIPPLNGLFRNEDVDGGDTTGSRASSRLHPENVKLCLSRKYQVFSTTLSDDILGIILSNPSKEEGNL